MGYRTASVNFSKGEISPEVEARFDLDVYRAALRKASNVIIRRTGGVRKRPGSRFVAKALSQQARLLPFQFSDTQAYCLEFGQAIMCPLALGGEVLETGLAVTAITKAANAQVTAAFHGYSVGDPIWFDGITGMVEINDRPLTVASVVDASNFTVNFNSTNASTFTGDAGGQVNSAPPSPPSTPPAVPPPATPPTPPTTGGGGSGGYTGGSGGGSTWLGFGSDEGRP